MPDHLIRPILATFLLIAAAASLPSVSAATDRTEPHAQQSGSLLFRMQSGYTVATRLDTDVAIKIAGLVADVRVRQRFRNDGRDWAEGVYVFPLPENASVRGMRLTIGERVIEGEIREKAEARRQYTQARASGRRASLVQQQRSNLFTTSVANVGPGEEIIVEIDYLEDLAFDDGTFSLRFPMTLTPRFIPGQPLADRHGSGWSADTDRVPDASAITPPVVGQSAGHRVSLSIDIDTGGELKHIGSRYHAIDVTEKNRRYSVNLASANNRLDHDFELTWTPVDSAQPRAMAFVEEAQARAHALVMVVPPSLPAESGTLPRDMTFVIDTSGSMQGVSIEQAKASLGLALTRLEAHDRFNIIRFNSTSSALFHESLPATPERVALAQAYVGRLSANGGTEMRPALQMALGTVSSEARLRQIVFITDGAVGNEEELFALVERELGNARLFTVGIGSAPNGWFMRKAAELGRGSFTTISALHEVGDKMQRLFRKLESPQLTNIRLTWPGRGTIEQYPATVADLYAGEPVVVKARSTGAFRPGDVLEVSGDSPGGAWTARIPLTAGSPHEGIAAIWGRAKIDALYDQERRGGDPATIRAAVVATGLAHSLVSKYTSLVAVDRTPARPAGASLRSDRVPNLLPHGQRVEAIFGFPATATPAGKLLLTGLALFCCALALLALHRICTMRCGPAHKRVRQ